MSIEIELEKVVQNYSNEEGKIPEITEDMSEQKKQQIHAVKNKIKSVLEKLRYQQPQN